MASAVFGSGKKLHSGYQSEVASLDMEGSHSSSLQEAKPPPSWNALLRLMSELFFDVSGSAQCPPPLASTSGQSQKVVSATQDFLPVSHSTTQAFLIVSHSATEAFIYVMTL